MIRAAIVFGVAMTSLWALFRFTYVPYSCNAEISEITSTTNALESTVSGYERLVRARRHITRLEKLRDSCRTQVRVPMLTAANQEIIGLPDQALNSYRDALRIEQRPEIHMAIAALQLQLGQIDEAVDSYVEAARFTRYLVRTIPSQPVRARVEERVAQLPRPSSE
jgi:hypothetical protein